MSIRSGERPAKRRRDESTVSSASEPSNGAGVDVVVDKIRFEDGNVVLAANSPETQKRHLFKVHKSVLAKHSHVWRTMFQINNVASEDAAVGLDEVFDGVPVVLLSDNANDVEDLLETIYEPTHLPFEHLNVKTVLKVSGVLRLATKYEIDSLSNRITTMLKKDWPSTLKEWDALEKRVNEAFLGRDPEREDMADVFPEPAAIIRLAKECNIPSMLPAAFYHLSRVFWRRGQLHLKDLAGHTSVETRTAQIALLDAENLKQLIVGREALRARFLKFFTAAAYGTPRVAGVTHLTFLRNNCECINPANPNIWPCKKGLFVWWAGKTVRYIMASGLHDHPQHLYDPLATLHNLGQELLRPTKPLGPEWNKFCGPCRSGMANILVLERHTLWLDLPRIFDIDVAWKSADATNNIDGAANNAA